MLNYFFQTISSHFN